MVVLLLQPGDLLLVVAPPLLQAPQLMNCYAVTSDCNDMPCLGGFIATYPPHYKGIKRCAPLCGLLLRSILLPSCCPRVSGVHRPPVCYFPVLQVLPSPFLRSQVRRKKHQVQALDFFHRGYCLIPGLTVIAILCFCRRCIWVAFWGTVI